MIVRLLAVGAVEALLVLLSLLLMLTYLIKVLQNTFDGLNFHVKPTSCNAFNPNNICTKIRIASSVVKSCSVYFISTNFVKTYHLL